ncbi:hypothetical protein CJJ23_01515 [Mycoplasmopsis agassizii]|uniref:Uncharacterized protein n=1 Tax=Mycoplasmopsis agassizii TaxID=33922 RepID=A0A269TKY6_9BACT|nr:hypothetical protein [Mycoplasmopsis agassizii]PAK21608.1 hypothetical protein CJJ23_01515 [Mycoplasmopsis agassizii]
MAKNNDSTNFMCNNIKDIKKSDKVNIIVNKYKKEGKDKELMIHIKAKDDEEILPPGPSGGSDNKYASVKFVKKAISESEARTKIFVKEQIAESEARTKIFVKEQIAESEDRTKVFVKKVIEESEARNKIFVKETVQESEARMTEKMSKFATKEYVDKAILASEGRVMAAIAKSDKENKEMFAKLFQLIGEIKKK